MAEPKKDDAKKDEAKTVTITFSGDDLALYGKLKNDADEDDRTISVYILRNLRSYESPK